MSFDRFWQAYPRKIAKSAARKAWDRLQLNELMIDHVIESVERHKRTRQWQDKQYIPHATTWLNQRRWEDELDASDFMPDRKPEPTARERNEQEARERIERRNARLAGLAAEAGSRIESAHVVPAEHHSRPRAPEPPPPALPPID